MISPGSAPVPLGRSIGRTHKFVRAYGDRELAPLDATVTEWIVLFHIGAAPAPGASQSEIARFSEMGAPALVRHIDRLEADGIVTRTRDADDRRITRLTLTPAGESRLDDLREVMARCDAELRSAITAEEADVLQRALDQLFSFCHAQLADGSSPPGAPLAPPPAGDASPSTPRPRRTR